MKRRCWIVVWLLKDSNYKPWHRCCSGISNSRTSVSDQTSWKVVAAALQEVTCHHAGGIRLVNKSQDRLHLCCYEKWAENIRRFVFGEVIPFVHMGALWTTYFCDGAQQLNRFCPSASLPQLTIWPLPPGLHVTVDSDGAEWNGARSK